MLLRLLVVGMLALPCAFAASLSGRVTDSQGRAVPGATVRLFAGQTEIASAVSDDTGHYRFSDAPPAAYEVRAEAQGFAVSAATVKLAAGEQQMVDLPL